MSSISWESDTEEIEVIKKPAKRHSNSDSDEEASTDAESDAEQESEENASGYFEEDTCSEEEEDAFAGTESDAEQESEENASGYFEEDTCSEEEEDAFAGTESDTEENSVIKKNAKRNLDTHANSDSDEGASTGAESDAEQESEENASGDLEEDTCSEEEEDAFAGTENSYEILIASWNLQGLKKEKCNTHFLEIICNTITSNSLGIVAIQEVVDKDAVKTICNKLNENHGGWEYTISERAGQGSSGFEYHAYLFNKKLGIQTLNAPELLQLRKYTTPLVFYLCEPRQVSWNENVIFTKEHIIQLLNTKHQKMVQQFQLKDGLDDSYKVIREAVFDELKTQNKDKLNVRVFTRDPFFASFKIGGEVFNLIGVHLKAVNRGKGNAALKRTRTEAESLLNLLDLYKDKFVGDDNHEKNIIILGDFNIPYTDESFQGLRKRKYESCIFSNTNISKENKGGSRSHDNIWLSKKIRLSYNKQNGNSGVIRGNLACKTCGTCVSDHCPVFVKLKK